MKKLLLVLLLGSFISCRDDVKEKSVDAKRQSQSLPAFKMLLMDSITKFNTGKIPTGKPVVLFFFGPDCPYCQALSKDIVAHIDKFKDIRVFFLSTSPFGAIKAYDTLFKLSKYPNVTIGQDYTGIFFNYFKGTGIPYLAIYNKEKKFKRIVLGAVKVDSLLTIING